ncbi:hypothetical protein P43SY_000922 [Pythium insidiosum]|uniref:Transmembrane protein n=1 Tax=Pythium insidiosum TaxID=114742 RepID=A0AAD5QAE1_PYTIN|nr:hypothetical protein P43SY_000922 [Pythium insidiosum]
MALMGSARVRLLVLLALMALLKSLALLKATSSASTTQPATESSTSLRQSAARDAVTTAMAPPLQSHQPDGLGVGVGVDDVDADDDDEKDDDLDRASQGNQLAVVATNASTNSYDSVLDRTVVHVLEKCCPGGEAVEGNLNEGFVMEPVVTLCVAFAPVPQLNPWLDFGEFHPQAKNLSFVSNFEVLARVPIIKQNHTWLQVALRKAMRNDEQFECDAESSEVSWEVDSDVDLKTGDHGQKVPYEVVLGTGKALAFCVHKRPLLLDTGKALAFCVHKRPLLLDTGEIQNPTVFVHHLELNTSHIRRRDRISVIYNPSTNALAKRPPPKGVRVIAGGTSF